MSDLWTVLLVATIGGIAVTLQGSFMGTMTRHMGTLESIFVTYGSGGLVIVLLMVLKGGGNLQGWRDVPLHTFSAGVLGLIIVGAIGFATARYGLILTFAVLLVAQYASAAVIDHFGLFGVAVQTLSPQRLVGIALLLLGAWLVMR